MEKARRWPSYIYLQKIAKIPLLSSAFLKFGESKSGAFHRSEPRHCSFIPTQRSINNGRTSLLLSSSYCCSLLTYLLTMMSTTTSSSSSSVMRPEEAAVTPSPTPAPD
eukprot:scaffold5195_cov152-Skeletonema_menzelii.AAC.1